MAAPAYVKKFTNLSFIFLLAYVSVHLLYQFSTYSAALFIGLPEAKCFFSYVDYETADYQLWSRLRVVLLYGLPTFILPIFALIYWVIMKKFSFAENLKVKLFLFWLILISLSFFIADFISAPFNKYGISVVASWLYLSKETMFGISLVFWISIPVLAYFNSSDFLRLANSRSYLKTKERRLVFLLKHIITPVVFSIILISGLILFTEGYSMKYYLSIDFVRMMVLIIVLLFVLIFNYNKRYIGIKKTMALEKVSVSFVFFTIISISVLYLLLSIV